MVKITLRALLRSLRPMLPISSMVAILALASCMTQAAPETLDRFPKSALVIESGPKRHSFDIWIADTDSRRQQGLMFVRDLPNATGMLFSFEPPQVISMWMKNTFIPLDMLFIDARGRILRIAERVRPHSLDIVSSGERASAVLEIAGGESARLGLAAGDRVRHDIFNTN